ncbi:MAG: DNA repair protein RecO [Candidatus Dormibacteria bacterium]
MPGSVVEGVVLRRVNYGDNDRILTVLTRERGKIGVMARGVRRAGSRMAAHTDLFAHSRMELARGRGDLDVLTAATSLAAVALTDARRAACAAVCAELADRVLEEGSPDEEVFDLVAAALAGCAESSRDPRLALLWLTRRIIDRLGYAPQLHACAACGAPLPERAAIFTAVAGGLLCQGCGDHAAGGLRCDVRVIKVLRVAAAGDAALYHRLALDEATLATLESVAECELAQHLDRQLRSLSVLRAIERR